MMDALRRFLRGMVKHPARIAIAALLVVVAYTCLSRCSFLVGGDSSLYISQTARLRGDYFTQNARALVNQDVEHVRLITEGGVAFIMFLVSLFHETLPFLLNAALIPCLLLVILHLGTASGGDDRSRWLTRLSILAVLFTTVSGSRLIACSLPFRDIAAHLFGFLGIVFAGRVVSKPESGSVVAAAAACVGLAAWCRVPNILFGVPVGLILVLQPSIWSLPPGKKARICICLGGGLLLGLLPLFGQNLFEGRALLEVGQVDALVNLDQGAKEGSRPKGLHPIYFASHVLPSLKLVTWKSFSWYGTALLVVGILTMMRRSWRWTVTLLGGAATFLGFYSCYDKIVGRYLLVVVLFGLPFAGLGLSWLIELFLRNIARDSLRQRFYVFVFVVLVGIAGYNCFGLRGYGIANLVHQYRDVRSFKTWKEAALEDSATVFSISQKLRMWLRYFGRPVQVHGPVWRDHRMTSVLPDTVHPADDPVYLALHELGDGTEQLSWYKDSLLNRYDLELSGRLELQTYKSFRTYRLTPRRTHERSLSVPVSPVSEGVLLLRVRALAEGVQQQSVDITSPEGTPLGAAELRAGLNVITLPDGPREQLVFRGRRPLPSFVDAVFMEQVPLRINLQDYRHIPSIRNMFEGGAVEWVGFRHWQRDWGGSGRERHESSPYWRILPGTKFDVPFVDGVTMIRLYCSLLVFTQDYEDLTPVMKEITYRLGENSLPHAMLKLGKVYRLGNEQGVGIDFVHELVLTEDPAQPGSPSTKCLEWNQFESEGPEPYLFLQKVEIGRLEHAVVQDRAELGKGVLLELPELHRAAMRACTSLPWIEPSMRLLYGSSIVPIPADEPASERLMYCVVKEPASSALQAVLADGRNVGLQEGVRIGRDRTMFLSREVLPAESTVVHLRLPAAVVQETPLLLESCGSMAIGPLEVTMDGRPYDGLLKGFWRPERQFDGVWRWSKPDATVFFPWANRVGDVRISIRLKGMPQGGGSIPVELRVNEQSVLKTAVPPGPNMLTITAEAVHEYLNHGLNTLNIRCVPWVPGQIFESNDQRELGVYVNGITIEPSKARSRQKPPR